MTLTITPQAKAIQPSQRALRGTYVASAAANANFFALLSVVPIHVARLGGGTLAVAVNTTAVMLACVIGELVAPTVARRFGPRTTITSALALLAAPSAISPVVTSIAATGVLGVVRGLGFGLIAVLGSATAARLAGPDRLASVMGTYGVATGLPAVIALPVGVWVANTAGTNVVFTGAALATLVGVAATRRLPRLDNERRQPMTWRRSLRSIALTRAALVFAAAAAASGAVLTFLPVITTHPDLTVAALFAHNGIATTARWITGRFDRRLKPRLLLTVSIVTSGSGVAALIRADHPTVQLLGMVLFGVGFGIAENTTITLMYRSTTPDYYGVASSIWNATYDAGLGAGAFLFGLAAMATSNRVAFAITAAVIALSLGPAYRATSNQPTTKEQGRCKR